MVIAFTIAALLIAAGHAAAACSAIVGGRASALVLIFALARALRAGAADVVPDPWAHAAGERLPGGAGPDRDRLGRPVRRRARGESVQKIFYLPEAPTDFILAVIGEELGVVGVCALLFLYGLIAYAGLRARARRARSLYAPLIAVGVTSLIVSQALLNMFAVLGLAPLTGVPLPFVSYGSSSLIVMLAAMGLLLNVAGGGTATCARCRRRGATRADGAPAREQRTIER